MKSKKLDTAHAVAINRDHWDVPLRVALRPYMVFCRRIEGGLEELVAQWAHTAAPNTKRMRLLRRR